MEKIAKLNQLPFKIFMLLVVNDFLDTSGQLLMKKGLGHADLNSLSSFLHLFSVGPDRPLFWIGLFIYISNFFLWMYILSKIDLSIAIPVASTSYILIPTAAIIFLHEVVSPLRWLGLLLILLGIYFVTKSKPSRGGP